MKDLDEILNGDPDVDLPETSPDTEPDKAEVQAEEPDKGEGEKAPDDKDAKGEKEEPPSSKDEPVTVPVKALEDERRKRQELEHKLQSLEGQLEKTEPAPDPNEDPEGFQKWQQQQNERLQSVTDERLFNERCAMSEMLVKSQKEDYDEAYQAFEKAVQDEAQQIGYSPLAVALRRAENPALFAYEHGKKTLLMAQIGDPEQYRKAAYDEGYQAALRELEAKPRPPTSLASETSNSGRRGPDWNGPAPLSEILPD